MKYSLGETLADYGFSFFEKLHTPIFLLHKNGSVKKINEAGRKLLRVGHISREQMHAVCQRLLNSNLACQTIAYQRDGARRKQIKLISKHLGVSDYWLIELTR